MNHPAPLHIQQTKIRSVRAEDLAYVVALDYRVTGLEKREYWDDIFKRYSDGSEHGRYFLIAEAIDETTESHVLGFIIGEIRDWEFGSEPCGWVFAFSVEPDTRQQGIGENLFDAISGKFRDAGIATMRTMVSRQNQLHMAFFRSEGMVAGPYIQLEKDLNDPLDY